ncbi:MAG: hypothetical protein ACTSRG_00770 [Candidatus Helarchaeota archaeon]
MSLEDRVNKLEKALEEINKRLDRIEGTNSPQRTETLAAPIPTSTEKKLEAAPIPSTPSIQPTVKKKQIIKQTLPRGGAVSQVKAKKGIYHCPQCDSDYYEELDDKTKPMYTMGPGMAIYKKKLRCWNCGHEWPKPT